MKVIIFYAKYGGGHLSAARSIENCINTYYKNVNVELIDFMEYANKEFNKITTKAYAEMAKKLPKAYGSIYWKSEKGPLAHISTTSNKLLSIKINKLFINIFFHTFYVIYIKFTSSFIFHIFYFYSTFIYFIFS